MLRRVCLRKFGLMDSVRRAINTPLAVTRDLFTPTGKDSNPMSHTNLAFDEVAQEWQAAIVEAPYEVQNSQSLDTIAQNNFGTVDNPHVIFTGDVPFRFVGCSGIPSEDDYDGHEFLLFLLREGPLQRCPSCGQVYKLVRIRDEASEMNDYYTSSLFSQDYQELGEADHFLQQNPIRAVLTFNYEHTLFEMKSDYLYSLANPDDHDRFLVDPAYRLERVKLMEEKNAVYNKVLEEIAESFDATHGAPKVHMNKENYDNLVKAEVAIEELDNHFKKVHKFKLRHMYDPVNHERREARMLERAKARLGDNITIYTRGFNDEYVKYDDYFETDNELEIAVDHSREAKSKAVTHPSMRIENLKFSEQWTASYFEDSQPLVKQKVFKFKYREALSTAEDHVRRETRMLSRLPENFARLEGVYNEFIRDNEGEEGELESPSYINKLAKEKALYDEIFRFNIQNYKNYFESDNDTDFDIITEMPNESRLDIIDGFYLEEINTMLEKIQFKSFTIGAIKGDDDGLFKTVLDVYRSTRSVLPGLQNQIDLHNFEEKSIKAFEKSAEVHQAKIGESNPQISDK